MPGQIDAQRARTYRKVGELIQEVFPDGTNVASDQKNSGVDDGSTPAPWYAPWAGVPAFAADVFAFAAHLITHTGAMGYAKLGEQTSHKQNDKGKSYKIIIGLDDRLIKDAHRAAVSWKKLGTPPPHVQKQWEIILTAWNSRASIALLRGERDKAGKLKVKQWWNALFSLLIVADEACEGLGHFVFDEAGKAIFANNAMARKMFATGQLTNKTPDIRSAMYRLSEFNWHPEIDGIKRAKMSIPSLTVAANPAVICVQPKGRVTSVGCSIRNLSRNLAAVGPLGSVRSNWQQLSRPTQGEKPGQLNLLLIPLPLEIKGTHFKRIKRKDSDTFSIEQKWLGNSDSEIDLLVTKISALVKKAMEDSIIHGVIFPEYALNYQAVSKIVPAIFDASKGKAMFMVTGTSENCEGEPGNIVMTHIWEGVCCREEGTATVPLGQQFREFSQRKHQRWRLDEAQIGTYGLGSQLDPSKTWWEDHDIGRRELHFFQIAEDTVFTSLICEDLARNDPCHDVIRAVSPNLVFALLMDGPQLPTRWPARFAGSLADDPGCTVLTLTSFGLIERSNFQFPEGGKSTVGLLRDSSGRSTEIALPPNKDAVIVSLQSKSANDKTMDGRATHHASKWKFVTQQPISIGLRSGDWKKR